jgi:hypothetical protein
MNTETVKKPKLDYILALEEVLEDRLQRKYTELDQLIHDIVDAAAEDLEYGLLMTRNRDILHTIRFNITTIEHKDRPLEKTDIKTRDYIYAMQGVLYSRLKNKYTSLPELITQIVESGVYDLLHDPYGDDLYKIRVKLRTV